MSVPAAEVRAVEVKGRMLTVTVLRVQSTELAAIEAELQQKLERGGSFLRDMPIVLELLAGGLDLRALHRLLRQQGLMPVALVQPAAEYQALARELGLGTLGDLRAGRERVAVEAAPPAAAPAVAPAPQPQAQRVPAQLVTEPVRSGQQVYARNGDLIVLATVNAGAEVAADGNVHVYGPLRGRAIAGVQGDGAARIFCRQFGAEIVAIAGCYKLTEDLEPAARQKIMGKAVQVRLDGESLKIEALG